MDPGFFEGGGANPPGGGALTYDFAKMYQKMHEVEKNLFRNRILDGLSRDDVCSLNIVC